MKNCSPLLALSPIDGRYHNKLDNIRVIFCEFGFIKFRVLVEVRWIQFLMQHANLPELSSLPQAHALLNEIIDSFSEQDALRIKQIENITNHDVKAVEYFLKERLTACSECAALSEWIHFGCTSEDINNLAYGLMLKAARAECILPALNKILITLTQFAHQYAEQPLLARTHGQPATPTTLGKEIANVVARLQRQRDQLTAAPILGKMNGASGNYNAHHFAYPAVDWLQFSNDFVNSLDLDWNNYTTQIEPHDYMAELFAVLMRINTILLDFNRDVWGYVALNYFTQKVAVEEVGSSTMPHKVNPIDFENAEGNLGIANALFEHFSLKLPISRWQRDLSDSTVLRNVGIAIAHTLLAYQSTQKGLSKLSPNIVAIHADLDQHWEILAEPIQTVMRCYGIERPYEKLKAFTRGKPVTKTLLHQFISELPLDHQVKEKLYALTPHQYVGYAAKLARI